jgi:hypothetical protein
METGDYAAQRLGLQRRAGNLPGTFAYADGL